MKYTIFIICISVFILTTNENFLMVIWKLRERMAESLMVDGYILSFDISISFEHFYESVEFVRELVKNRNDVIVVSGFGHMGDGNMHVNVTTPDCNLDLLHFLETAIYEWTAKHKGSISSEHGIGFMKREFLKYSKNDGEIALMKQLKTLLDSNGILNPYKVLP